MVLIVLTAVEAVLLASLTWNFWMWTVILFVVCLCINLVGLMPKNGDSDVEKDHSCVSGNDCGHVDRSHTC